MAFPLIAPATELLTQGFNAIQQGRQNRKSRRFSREMYNRQRADAIEFWNMQNVYNSPEQQMARLKAAGLNPNLVYGNGAVANSGSAPDKPSAMSAQFTAPRFSAGSVLSSYFDVQSRTKALEQQDANIVKTLAEAESLGYDNTVLGNTVDASIRKKNAEMLSAESQAELDMMSRNVMRDMLRHDVPLKKALLDVLYSKKRNARVDADIRKVKTDTRLKQMDVEVREILEGLPAGDAVKVLTSILQMIFK